MPPGGQGAQAPGAAVWAYGLVASRLRAARATCIATGFDDRGTSTMRRFLILTLMAVSLLSVPVVVRAQATADQLNKLSLEALTARPSGGGYAPSATRRAYYQPRRYRRVSYARYHRVSYARYHRTWRRPYVQSARYRPRYVGHAYRGRQFAAVSRHRAMAASHRTYRR